jgi:hypothetical protein
MRRLVFIVSLRPRSGTMRLAVGGAFRGATVMSAQRFVAASAANARPRCSPWASPTLKALATYVAKEEGSFPHSPPVGCGQLVTTPPGSKIESPSEHQERDDRRQHRNQPDKFRLASDRQVAYHRPAAATADSRPPRHRSG